MEKLVSVIMTVYQAEKYVSSAVESVLAAASDEVEVILVDDGSKDNSLKICRNFSKRDSRVKVYHQENKGVSSARNAGIQIAQGKYLMFLDADDTFVSEKWQDVLSLVRQNTYDFAAYSYYSLYENGKKTEERFPMEKEISCDRDFLMRLLLGSPLLCTCWGKLFRNSIVQRYNIQFPLKMEIGEDYLFVMEYIKHAEKTALVNKCVINYYQNSSSVMRNFKYEQRVRCMKHIWEYCREYTGDIQHQKYVPCMSMHQFCNVSYYARVICQSMKRKQALKALEDILNERFVQEIFGMVDRSSLSGYRKGEYYLLHSRRSRLIWGYFKVKALVKTD